MANVWGSNTIGPGEIVPWYFVRVIPQPSLIPPEPNPFQFALPVIRVIPLGNPTNIAAEWTVPDFGGGGFYTYAPIGYPQVNVLSASNLWVQMTSDSEGNKYYTFYMFVMNFSQETIEYAFAEADL